MQVYYALFQKQNTDLKQSVNELDKSVDKSLDLFFYLLVLVFDLRDYAEEKIAIGKQKFIPSEEELQQNDRFSKNEFLLLMEKNKQLKPFLNSQYYSWKSHTELLKQLWSDVKNADFYNDYIHAGKWSFNSDKEFVINIIKHHFTECKSLDEIVEEKSIYWNDDLEFILSILIAVIRKFKKEAAPELLLVSLYKDEEDKRFAHRLLELAVINHSEFDDIIMSCLKNWELDRIAMLDRLILHLALVEFYHMPEIPIKVTINEYLDIAKFYSTSKSNLFINGVLDKVYNNLKASDKLNKHGRGLLDNIE